MPTTSGWWKDRVEKRPTNYRDSEPRTTNFLKKKRRIAFWGWPQIPFKNTEKRRKALQNIVFAGFSSIFKVFQKEFGFGPQGGIFSFFEDFSGLGVLNPCSWSGVSQKQGVWRASARWWWGVRSWRWTHATHCKSLYLENPNLLNKDSRPFFPKRWKHLESIWSFPSFSSLSDYSIWSSWRLF